MLTFQDLLFFLSELNRLFPIGEEPSGNHSLSEVDGKIQVTVFSGNKWHSFSTEPTEWEDLPQVISDIYQHITFFANHELEGDANGNH